MKGSTAAHIGQLWPGQESDMRYIRLYRCPSTAGVFPDVDLTPLSVFHGKGKLHIPMCAIKQLWCPLIKSSEAVDQRASGRRRVHGMKRTQHVPRWK